MKKQLGAVTLGAVALLTGCSGMGFGGDSPTFSGKIANWPAGKTGSIKVVAGSGAGVSGAAVPVDASGNFSNVAFPGATALAAVTTVISAPTCSGTGTVTASSTTAKTTNAGFQILNSTNANAGSVIEATRDPSAISAAPAVGDKILGRIFTDTAFTIKGTCTTSGTTTTYDVALAVGWNLLIGEVTAVNGTTTTAAKFYAGGLPGDAKLLYAASGAALGMNFFNK
jgi:hypothetical protein